MFAFYDPNAQPVPYRIAGSTYAASPTDQPGSMGGLPHVYIDDTQNPDVVANLGLYKIDPTTLLPVALTQAEIDALNASYVPPEPTTEEKLAALQKDHNLLKLSDKANGDGLNDLIDYLSQTGKL